MDNTIAPTPLAALIGRILSIVVVLILLADALVNLTQPQKIAAEMAATGFSAALATPLGIIILVCAVAYVIPPTAVVGAALITAFSGGAICAHFRLGEIGSPPQVLATLIAGLAWTGLLLRYPQLRAVLPLLRPDAAPRTSRHQQRESGSFWHPE